MELKVQNKKNDHIIITGTAGFIGSKVAEVLLNKGKRIIGIDNLNSYYDVRIKKFRLARLLENKLFKFKITILSFN